jgi:hypothetical protein
MAKLISIGEIIDSAWDFYRIRFTTYLNIAGWLLIVLILQIIALLFYPSTSTIATETIFSGWESFGILLYGFSSIILTPILGLWVFIALSKAAYAQVTRRSIDVKATLKDSWKLFFPSMLVGILVGLVFLGAIAIGVIPPVVIGYLGGLFESSFIVAASNFLLIFGIFISFILALRWSVHYIFAPYEVVLEGKRGIDALKVSRKMTEKKFWGVLLRIALPKLLFLVVGVLLMWIATYLSSMIISAIAGINTDLLARLTTYADTIIPAVIAILINPLLVLADVILYKNLRARW